MKKLKDKLSYQFDKIIRRDVYVQILGLSIIVLFVAVLGGFILGLGDNTSKTASNVWWSFLHIVDTGHLGEDKDIWHESIALIVTLGGLFVFGALVTIMNNAFAQRVEKLKKGKIKVVEEGHTVILGWGSTVFSVIEELIRGFDEDGKESANKQIVILANKDRDYLYDAVFQNCFSKNDADSKKKREKLRYVICRNGSIESYVDLEMVNLSAAQRVIILSDESNPDKQLEDARAVKALFAAIQDYCEKKNERGNVERPPVICLSVNNLTTADALQVLQKKKLLDLNINVSCLPDLLGRMIAQITIHPYLKDVYDDLLSYEGNEIYIHPCSEFHGGKRTGITFNELYTCVQAGIVIGVKSGGKITINPKYADADKPLSDEDEVIMVNEDDKGELHLLDKAEINISSITRAVKSTMQKSKKVLVVGDGEIVKSIIRHIVDFLPDDSVIYHTSNNKYDSDKRRNIVLSNVMVENNLDAQCRLIAQQKDIDILVLADDESNSDIHDSQVLVKISAAKNAYSTLESNEPRIVAEFLDPRNADLAAIADVKVFVVSTKMASNYLVQVLNRPERKAIIDDMLSPNGDDLCLRTLGYYVVQDSIRNGISFAQIMMLSRERGDLAIGYITQKTGKMILNPRIEERAIMMNPADIHSIIVIGPWQGCQ